MHRHFVVALGNWQFVNWHLFRYRQVSNKKGNVRWMQWHCVFCGKPLERH